MLKRILIVIFLALLCVGTGFGISAARQASPAPNAVHLPLVANGTAAPNPVKILDGDYTLVSIALSPDGCEYGALMDRGGGNLIHVGRIDGDTFIELEQMPQPTAPAFVPEGAKHAGMDLVVVGDHLDLFFTARPEGATSGGFDFWRLSVPLPECRP